MQGIRWIDYSSPDQGPSILILNILLLPVVIILSSDNNHLNLFMNAEESLIQQFLQLTRMFACEVL